MIESLLRDFATVCLLNDSLCLFSPDNEKPTSVRADGEDSSEDVDGHDDEQRKHRLTLPSLRFR